MAIPIYSICLVLSCSIYTSLCLSCTDYIICGILNDESQERSCAAAKYYGYRKECDITSEYNTARGRRGCGVCERHECSALQLKNTATATAANMAVKEIALDAEAPPFWVEPVEPDPPDAVGAPADADPLAEAVAKGKVEVWTGAVDEGLMEAVPSSTVK